jgi:glycosyltransferase involved in cell wall biosynthesis
MGAAENCDVSVVILTKNSARTINKCLKSVISEKPGEILVVDGLSTDGTLRILKQYGVTVLFDHTNSLGYSRQMGVQAAKGVYVMFVDSDVTLASGCISMLRRDLREHGWTGIQARNLSAENLSYWQRAQAEVSREHDRAGPANRIGTGATLFRREILLACPFDRDAEEAAEDGDLCRRLVEGNHRLGVSTAVAYHYHRRQLRAFVTQQFRYGLGRARLGVKYGIRVGTAIDPLLEAFYQMVRDVVTGRVWLLPYQAVAGLIPFLGTAVGISRLRRAQPLRTHNKNH